MNRTTLLTALLSLVLTASTGLQAEPGETAVELVAIANPSVIEEEISPAELKDIFNDRKTSWRDGSRIRLAILKEGPVHESVLTDIAGTTPEQYRSFWRIRTFTGKGTPPVSLSTEEDLVAYVKANPGAFAVVGSSSVTEGVKVIEMK